MTIELCCNGVPETVCLPENTVILCAYLSRDGSNVVSILDGDYEWFSSIYKPVISIEKQLPSQYKLSLRALSLWDDQESRVFMEAWRGLVFVELELEDISLKATY